MPIDIDVLSQQARAAYQGLLVDKGYVRGGKFIAHFQRHARHELGRLGLPPPVLGGMRAGSIKFELRENGVVLGAYFPKELDLFLEGNSSGPLLGVSFKCMMSDIAGNVNNRWEEMVGDASNLHSRFPMLTFGFMMVLPWRTRPTRKREQGEIVIDPDGAPTPLARQIEGKLRGITGRRKPVELPTTYEEVALAVIDFDHDPPRLHPTFPGQGLRIETFFDSSANASAKGTTTCLGFGASTVVSAPAGNLSRVVRAAVCAAESDVSSCDSYDHRERGVVQSHEANSTKNA